jgi:hypothetical protein
MIPSAKRELAGSKPAVAVSAPIFKSSSLLLQLPKFHKGNDLWHWTSYRTRYDKHPNKPITDFVKVII